MKSTFKKIGYFLKKHIFSVICLLLATIICISGTLSYSKYITSDITPGGASAGSFTASASINGISALSFTNTAFWGGTESSDKIAMNALRQIKFSVNNYQTDSEGNKKVAEVRMRYNLVFSAPTNFVEKLAFQVFDAKDVALFPQIVIADLLAKKSGEQYDTSSSVDYNGQAVGDLTFTVTKATVDGMETVTAVSSNGISIKFTKFSKEVDQTLLFRLWDVSSLTSAEQPTISNEGGKIKPPVTVKYKENVEFYKISVTMPSFVLPAAVATTINHSIQLAPTSAIDDNHLGGTLVNTTKDSSGNVTSASPVTSIYGPSTENQTVNGTIQTLVESTVDTYYNDSSLTGEAVKTESSTSKVFGNVLSYEKGKTTTSTFSTQTSKDLSLDPSESTSVSVGETTTTTSYSWNNYQFTTDGTNLYNSLLNGEKDFTNSNLDSFVAIATAGDYGTLFYVHKIPATQTGTKTESKMISKTLASKSEVADTTITETMTCDSIGTDGKISLRVTKETVNKVSENKVYKIVSNDTISTVTRNGYIYICFYHKYEENSTETKKAVIYPGGVYDELYAVKYNSSGSIEYNEKANSLGKYTPKTTGVLYKNQVMFYETTSGTNTICNYFGEGTNDQYSQETNVQTLTDTSNILESTKKSDNTNTEYIKREITRDYSYLDINITEVSVSESTVEETATTTKKKVYTSGTPLNLFDGNIQKLFLSTSYSKNYPFYVDVIFEQVLN